MHTQPQYVLTRRQSWLPVLELSAGIRLAASSPDVIWQKQKSDIQKDFSAPANGFYPVSDLSQVLFYRYDTDAMINNQSPFIIHEVSIPGDAECMGDEVGHNDGVSNFSIYHGQWVNKLEIVNSYNLEDEKDLLFLLGQGLLNNEPGSLFISPNIRPLIDWLIQGERLSLYRQIQDVLPAIDMLSAAVLYDRTDIAEYILTSGQLESDDESNMLGDLEYYFKQAIENDNHKLVSLLNNRVQYNPVLLIEGVKNALKKGDEAGIEFYLQLFEGYPEDLTCIELISYATSISAASLLTGQLEVWLSVYPSMLPFLINVALACDSQELLLMLEVTKEMLDLTRESMLKYFQNDEFSILIKSGSFYNVLERLPGLNQEQLNDGLLLAAESGYAGIVKRLLDQGADPCTWGNRAIKIANRDNFRIMKAHLLEHGVPDVKFDSY